MEIHSKLLVPQLQQTSVVSEAKLGRMLLNLANKQVLISRLSVQTSGLNSLYSVKRLKRKSNLKLKLNMKKRRMNLKMKKTLPLQKSLKRRKKKPQSQQLRKRASRKSLSKRNLRLCNR